MPSADFLGMNEPQLSSLFLCYFTRLPNLTPLYVKSVNIPNLTWGEIKVGYFVSERKFATRAVLEDVKLDIKDFIDVGSAAAIYAWQKSVGDPNAGILNPPASYKSAGVLIVTDGRGSPVNTWTMKGCFPKVCNFGTFESDTGSALIEVSITVSIDTIEMA